MKPIHIAVVGVLCAACALVGFFARGPAPTHKPDNAVSTSPAQVETAASPIANAPAVTTQATQRRAGEALRGVREAASLYAILDGDTDAIAQWRQRRRMLRQGAIRVGTDREIIPEDDQQRGPMTDAEANEVRKALAEIHYSKPPPLDFASMKPGDFGTLALGVWRFERGNVLQVVDGNNLIARVFANDMEIRFWLTGPTTGIVDGTGLDVSGLFECVGTKQYNTVVGSTATIYHLRKLEAE